MIIDRETIIRVSNKMKNAFKDEEVLDFIKHIGYVNRGTYEKDVNQMLINEGKREIALTIGTLVNEPTEAILAHFEEVPR
jgi:hypothetical protein